MATNWVELFVRLSSFGCHRPHAEYRQALQGDHRAHCVEDVEGREHEDPAGQGWGGETPQSQTFSRQDYCFESEELLLDMLLPMKNIEESFPVMFI